MRRSSLFVVAFAALPLLLGQHVDTSTTTAEYGLAQVSE